MVQVVWTPLTNWTFWQDVFERSGTASGSGGAVAILAETQDAGPLALVQAIQLSHGSRR